MKKLAVILGVLALCASAFAQFRTSNSEITMLPTLLMGGTTLPLGWALAAGITLPELTPSP